MIRIRKIHWHYLNHLGSSSCVFWECNLCVLPPNPCPASPLLSLLTFSPVFLLLPSSSHFVRTKRVRHLSVLERFFSHLIKDRTRTNINWRIIIPEFLSITVYVFSRTSVTLESFDFISALRFYEHATIHIFRLYLNFIFFEIYTFRASRIWNCGFVETLRNLPGLP